MAKRNLVILFALLVLFSTAFLAWNLRGPIAFILELRAVKLLGLLCIGAATGAATILFQTVTANRLLTPNIVGFDALFVLLQSLLVLAIGGIGVAQLPDGFRFFAECAALMLAAGLLFGTLLKRDASDIMRMVLTGVILGVLLRGLSAFVQRLIDPSEYAVVQQASFASFNAIDTSQLGITLIVLLISFAVAIRLAPSLDIAGLGRDGARSLGLNYDRIVLISLFLIAAMISVSTALVGPITFLGLLAASLARLITDTHKHTILIPAASAIGALILVSGQFVFERLLALESTLSVVVEFFGGCLFLLLVLRKSKP